MKLTRLLPLLAEIDTITRDWGKLNIIGPQITDLANKTFFTPNRFSRMLQSPS